MTNGTVPDHIEHDVDAVLGLVTADGAEVASLLDEQLTSHSEGPEDDDEAEEEEQAERSEGDED